MHLIFTNVDLLSYVLSYLDYYEEMVRVKLVIKDKRPLTRWLSNTKRKDIVDIFNGRTRTEHYVNDKLQSEDDKPAVIVSDALTEWYHLGKLLQSNNMVIYEWFKFGNYERYGLPHIVEYRGDKIVREAYIYMNVQTIVQYDRNRVIVSRGITSFYHLGYSFMIWDNCLEMCKAYEEEVRIPICTTKVLDCNKYN